MRHSRTDWFREPSRFIIELEKKDIPVWNNCAPHLTWKNDYAKYVQSKAIFDWE
ncbi:MAG: hypothetical protein IIZ55_03310 [Firmicutes bacterium]|nr:hypothetical protein [Bacillota bacterium]